MKIDFEDGSYIEVARSNEGDKVIVTILAKDFYNSKKEIINSVEISQDQLKTLFAEMIPTKE